MNVALRIAVWLLAIAFVVVPPLAVLKGWVGAQRWPLTTLRVHGSLQRVDPQSIRTALLPYAQRGFFAVDLTGAQVALEQLPWVEKADVRKRWPNVLDIDIVEHQPFARWDEDKLLTAAGRLYPLPKNVDVSSMPQLGGPETEVADVVALYNESKQMFAPLGLDVRTLRMDQRGSCSLDLSDGIEVVVGRDDARPRISRFARLLPQLLAKNVLLQRADLRYTNGFALSWGKAPPATEVKAGT